jgi:hypothetical protein
MTISKLAGKYLGALDPSVEIARIKIASSLSNLRPSYVSSITNPELLMQSKQPAVAFDSAGLGFDI